MYDFQHINVFYTRSFFFFSYNLSTLAQLIKRKLRRRLQVVFVDQRLKHSKEIYHKRMYYIMRLPACLVVNPVTVDNFAPVVFDCGWVGPRQHDICELKHFLRNGFASWLEFDDLSLVKHIELQLK